MHIVIAGHSGEPDQPINGTYTPNIYLSIIYYLLFIIYLFSSTHVYSPLHKPFYLYSCARVWGGGQDRHLRWWWRTRHTRRAAPAPCA